MELLDNAKLQGYFKKGEERNGKFFRRLEVEPTFDGLKVLDVGCGLGSLCLFVAERGPSHVVGIDIDKEGIDFANQYLQRNCSHLADRVEFRYCDINGLDECDFDVILSKDSFEHIMDLENQLHAMIAHLKPGGRMLIGFGPLYNSPFGDHRRTKSKVPWGHLMRSEKSIVKRINALRAGTDKNPIASIHDLGLNMLSFKEYRRIIESCGLEVRHFGVNVNERLGSKILTLFSKVPFLREYFTHNIYCVLRKP